MSAAYQSELQELRGRLRAIEGRARQGLDPNDSLPPENHLRAIADLAGARPSSWPPADCSTCDLIARRRTIELQRSLFVSYVTARKLVDSGSLCPTCGAAIESAEKAVEER